MRKPTLVLTAALFIVARPGSAQVSVIAPAAGAASSYRTTTLSWDAMPGASSYHVEIDDDPNFGSPEVDVTVSGTQYTLSAERLNLNGRLSWAAYVRINGQRWNAGTFTPSFLPGYAWPTLTVDSNNNVYWGYHALEGNGTKVFLTSSSDWSAIRRLSLADTFNPWYLDLAVTDDDVVHANWAEQRWNEPNAHFYTNSALGWELIRLPNPFAGGGAGGIETPFLVGSGRFDIFQAPWGSSGIQRFTSVDGRNFDRTLVPNSSNALNVSPGRDAAGNVYLLSSGSPDLTMTLRSSGDGWLPHPIGNGWWPTLVVASDGGQHVLRREYGFPGSTFFYSNSARGFGTWTALPFTGASNYQDMVPLVLDEARGLLHTALDGSNGVQMCSSSDVGWNWSCATVSSQFSYQPDLVLAPDGTLHMAWSDSGERGRVAYANSLGSFLATNFAPEVSFGPPASDGAAVVIPTAISDADRDDLSGDIEAGRYETVTSQLASGETAPILQGQYTLVNQSNYYLHDPSYNLQFRIVGGYPWWDYYVNRAYIPSFPATVEVRIYYGEPLGSFTIPAWDDAGVTIAQTDFVAYATPGYSGALPYAVDIAALPQGASVLRVSASDGASITRREQAFTKEGGHAFVLLTSLDEVGGGVSDAIDDLDPDALKNANQVKALRNKLEAVLDQIRRALDETDGTRREAMLADALSKLRNDILAKSDGCAVGGAPDSNDWVTVCDSQQPLYAAVRQLIAFVEAL